MDSLVELLQLPRGRLKDSAPILLQSHGRDRFVAKSRPPGKNGTTLAASSGCQSVWMRAFHTRYEPGLLVRLLQSAVDVDQHLGRGGQELQTALDHIRIRLIRAQRRLQLSHPLSLRSQSLVEVLGVIP